MHSSAAEDEKAEGNGPPAKAKVEEKEADPLYDNRPQMECVDLNLIKDNVCTNHECYPEWGHSSGGAFSQGTKGKPHRHEVN